MKRPVAQSRGLPSERRCLPMFCASRHREVRGIKIVEFEILNSARDICDGIYDMIFPKLLGLSMNSALE